VVQAYRPEVSNQNFSPKISQAVVH